jgi:amino acid transporter
VVAGGPYGAEPAVQAAGPLFALLGFLVFPFVWAVPESLVTAELSTAMPGNGGYVVWVDRAFGPFAGSLMGTWKYVCSAFSAAAFPALCSDYLARVAPAVSHGGARVATIVTFNVALSFLNYTGLSVVGWSAVALGLASLSPFLVMSGVAVPKIRPHRWAVTAGEKDWKLFLNTLFWNLNYWDSVSTMAGEVDRPGKTFPKALLSAVCMASLGYLLPLMAGTGATDSPPEAWGNGYFADAAGTHPSTGAHTYSTHATRYSRIVMLYSYPVIILARVTSEFFILQSWTCTSMQVIAGKWLKYWIEVGAVLSSIGLYSASMSSAAYLLAGMADLGLLPPIFASRDRAFGTPWASIAVTGAIALGMSFSSFTSIVAASNFLYSLGMLLEFATFVWLRIRWPALPRPYRVPMGTVGVAAMCSVPSAFLVLVMAVAGWKVYVTSAAFTLAGAAVSYVVAFCKTWGCVTQSGRADVEGGCQGSHGDGDGGKEHQVADASN